MSSDIAFVQSCADRLGVGYITAGRDLDDLRKLLLHVLGAKPASVQHLKRLLMNSPAACVIDVASALNPQEEARLFGIITK